MHKALFFIERNNARLVLQDLACSYQYDYPIKKFPEKAKHFTNIMGAFVVYKHLIYAFNPNNKVIIITIHRY